MKANWLCWIGILSLTCSLGLIAADGEEWPSNLIIPPDVTDPNVRIISGVTPFRIFGPRIERDKSVRGIKLYHNYGHGGAGYTLAPGSASIVVNLAIEDIDTAIKAGKPIIVIGSGIIGLSVIDELLDRGLTQNVILYADHFPPDREVTSMATAGLFTAIGVHLPPTTRVNLPLSKELLERSFRKYGQYSLKPGWGVTRTNMYVADNAWGPSGLERLSELNLFVSKFFHYSKLPIQGVNQPGFSFPTVILDPPVFLMRLFQKVSESGITITKRKFLSMDDLTREVEEGAVVFNCTGVGARALVGDQDIWPVAVNVVEVKQPLETNPLANPFVLYEGETFVLPRHDSIVIGGDKIINSRRVPHSRRSCVENFYELLRWFGQIER